MNGGATEQARTEVAVFREALERIAQSGHYHDYKDAHGGRVFSSCNTANCPGCVAERALAEFKGGLFMSADEESA